MRGPTSTSCPSRRTISSLRGSANGMLDQISVMGCGSTTGAATELTEGHSVARAVIPSVHVKTCRIVCVQLNRSVLKVGHVISCVIIRQLPARHLANTLEIAGGTFNRRAAIQHAIRSTDTDGAFHCGCGARIHSSERQLCTLRQHSPKTTNTS